MKHRILSWIFVFILVFFGVLHVIVPDRDISHTERRALAQFPSGGMHAVLDGVFMENMEKYLPDQFPLRESFRSLKAGFERLSGRLDSNDIYDVNGCLASLEFGYSEKAVRKSAEKLSRLRYIFSECETAVVSVIPPKNFYMHNGVHPVPDFDALIQTMILHTDGYGFCDISDTLTLESYYRTDSHWRQETLDAAAEKLCTSLGVTYIREDCREHRLENFYGVYAGQSALPVKPDTLIYRTSPSIQNASVSAVGSDITSVYTPDTIGVDDYDIFLGGAVPVIRIVNESGRGNLIIVRDSFGSSLIPLLIPTFRTITAVDLRYISSDYLDRYVDQDNASLLILLSAGILSNSEMLKIQ